MGDDKITWLVGYRNFTNNAMNGFATPRFDKELGQALIEVTDLSFVSNKGAIDGSYDGFFNLLWGKLVDQIEGSVR
jgi:hypothetical protein